jgi:hypothetical protein
MTYAYRKILMAACLVFCLFSSVWAYSGGTGTPANPYKIANVADWNDLMNTSGDWDKYFILTANLDFNEVALLPVGSAAVNFTGALDGNSCIIRNIDINIPDNNCVSLFGYIGLGSQVHNLGIENVRISGSIYVGGLAGYNKGVITACYVTGTVTGNDDYTGGLAGYSAGTITDCNASVTVIGNNSYVGGLAGFNYEGSVSDCCAAGTVNGNSNVGGLVGRNFQGNIANCCACGAVEGSDYGGEIGGLVGSSTGDIESSTISNCHATGNVSGSNGNLYIGGLVGYNYQAIISDCYAAGAVGNGDSVGGLAGYSNRNSIISNCYASGDVNGTSNIGGLVGHNDHYSSLIDNCYASGKVSGINKIGGLVGYNRNAITNCYSVGQVVGNSNAGGLVGYESGNGDVNDSFWDTLTSGKTTSAGGTGKNTAEMKDINTFLDAGWDFVEETTNGTDDIWKIRDGANYPKLAWQQSLPGDFVYPDGVYLEDLAYFIQYWLSINCGTNNNCDGTDLNTDGTVNFIDFVIFANSWLKDI